MKARVEPYRVNGEDHDMIVIEHEGHRFTVTPFLDCIQVAVVRPFGNALVVRPYSGNVVNLKTEPL